MAEHTHNGITLSITGNACEQILPVNSLLKENQMAKQKRKLTATEKSEKKRRRREYMTIFVNGKQKRVKKEPTIDGISVDEFIQRNADPIYLLQNEMYEELHKYEQEELVDLQSESTLDFKKNTSFDDDLPF